MNEELQDELILKYIDGEMNPEEKELFEDRLKMDPALQERLSSLRLAISAVDQFGTIDKIRNIHNQIFQESAERRKSRVIPMRKAARYALAVAASTALIFFVFRFFAPRAVDANTLYLQAYVDYQVSATRGNKGLDSTEVLFSRKDHQGVISRAGIIDVKGAKDSLLTGLSFLQTGREKDAISWLQPLTSSQQVGQDAEFYLAMAYLKERSYEQAGNLIRKIYSSPDHLYRERFNQEYLEDLQKLK
jgi:hypothetical protein